VVNKKAARRMSGRLNFFVRANDFSVHSGIGWIRSCAWQIAGLFDRKFGFHTANLRHTIFFTTVFRIWVFGFSRDLVGFFKDWRWFFKDDRIFKGVLGYGVF
jgi:hypothetical protein